MGGLQELLGPSLKQKYEQENECVQHVHKSPMSNTGIVAILMWSISNVQLYVCCIYCMNICKQNY